MRRVGVKRIFLLLFMVFALSGCNDFSGQEIRYTLTTGTTGQNEINEITKKFTISDAISFELEGNKEIGTPIKILIIKHNNGKESIISSYDEDIDLTWGWVHYSFGNFDEMGEYSFRVFNTNNKLLGESRFTVTD